MKSFSTHLERAKSVTHPLALTVINDSATYASRVYNAKHMTARHYQAYLLKLVNAEAVKQRREFNCRFKPADITQAWEDLQDAMRSHMEDMRRVESEA